MRKRSELKDAVGSAGEDVPPEVKVRGNSPHSVAPSAAAALCLYVGVLFVAVMYVDRRLPAGLRIADEPSYPDRFVAERAQRDLRVLTSIGPRVVGSHENEFLAVDVLLRRLDAIRRGANEAQRVDVDLQVVSGSYYLDYHPFGGYNAYADVQNVVVRLSGSSGQRGILVNAHFDSVPTSPGGSDDGINCAVMLEVLRKLSEAPERRRHDVVFLFNGAEETPLQASHGFITEHRWRADVDVVVNLEAAGSGGKEILFQSGPDHSWLLDYYRAVPRPHGQAAGEEIFQSNLIPSDTDFRNFRDFGGLIGYDIAFARNGYRYHTSFDDFESIPLGTYQHVGDNVLHLVRSLADARELEEPRAPSKKAVYYDLFGLYMVCYNEVTAVTINVFVLAFSVAIFHVNLKELGLRLNRNLLARIFVTAGAILVGWVLALVTTLLTAVLLDSLNRTMTWYSKPWVLIGLYIVPTVVFSAVPIMLLNKYKPSKFGINVQSQLVSHANRLIWTLVLFIGICLNIRSSYVVMLPVLFNSIFFAIIVMINKQYSVKQWRLIYIVINSFPVLMTMYQAILVLTLFIPITGRIGNDRNPELIVGGITSLVAILISSFFMHYVPLLNNPKTIFAPLIVTFITLGIVVSPAGFQYSGDHRVPTPQRYMIYHTNRVARDEFQTVVREDAGFLVLNLDRNAPHTLKPHIPGIDGMRLDVNDCQELLVCGLPLPSPRVLAIMKEQLWIPAERPVLYERPTLSVLERKPISSTLVRFIFEVAGPSHTNVYFSPRGSIELFQISLAPVIPENLANWNNRSVYFINYNWGKTKKPLQFAVELETPQNWTGAVLDIAVSGKEFSRNIFGVEFHEFLNRFPSWTNVVPVVATFESWVF